MRRFSLPSLEARIAFYCGIVSFGLHCIVVVGNGALVILCLWTFAPLLLIPIIESPSRKGLLTAFLLSPILAIPFFFATSALAVDSRTLSVIPLLVPGGGEMNPGGPMDNLIYDLIVFAAMVSSVLAPKYWRTRIIGLPYGARAILGTAALALVLHDVISQTTFSFESSRLGATIWLICAGLWTAFLFGVKSKSTP